MAVVFPPNCLRGDLANLHRAIAIERRRVAKPPVYAAPKVEKPDINLEKTEKTKPQRETKKAMKQAEEVAKEIDDICIEVEDEAISDAVFLPPETAI